MLYQLPNKAVGTRNEFLCPTSNVRAVVSDCGMDERSVLGDVVDNGTAEDGAGEADDPDDGGDCGDEVSVAG